MKINTQIETIYAGPSHNLNRQISLNPSELPERLRLLLNDIRIEILVALYVAAIAGNAGVSVTVIADDAVIFSDTVVPPINVTSQDIQAMSASVKVQIEKILTEIRKRLSVTITCSTEFKSK